MLLKSINCSRMCTKMVSITVSQLRSILEGELIESISEECCRSIRQYDVDLWADMDVIHIVTAEKHEITVKLESIKDISSIDLDDCIGYRFDIEATKSLTNLLREKELVRLNFLYCVFDYGFEAHQALLHSLSAISCIYRDRFVFTESQCQHLFQLRRCRFSSLNLFASHFFDGFVFRDNEVSGDFTLDRGLIDYIAVIQGNSFEGRSTFNGAEFMRSVNFNERDDSRTTYSPPSMFIGETEFMSTKFRGETYFDGVSFLNGVKFIGTLFEGRSFFSVDKQGKGCVFVNPVFHHTTFNDSVHVKNALFRGSVDMRLIESRRLFFLNNISLDDSLILRDCDFSGKVSIRMNASDQKRIQHECQFMAKSCNFSNGFILKGKIYSIGLERCEILGTVEIDPGIRMISLEDSVIIGDMGLSQNVLDGLKYLNLNNTTIQGSMDLGDDYEAIVALIDDTDLYDLPVPDPYEDDEDDYDYEDFNKQETISSKELSLLLVKNEYEKSGRFEIADKLYYELMEAKRERIKQESFKGWIKGVWLGLFAILSKHGTDVTRLLIWVIIIPIIFALFCIISGMEALFALKSSYVSFLTMSLGLNLDYISDLQSFILIVDGFVGLFLISYMVTIFARWIQR